MKRTAALLLIVGLVALPAYAQVRPGEPISPWALKNPPIPGLAERIDRLKKPASQTSSPSSGKSSKQTEQIDIAKVKSGGNFVTLNFTNIDINALIKLMSELTGRNFILDDRVAGKITIMTPTKISPEEAYRVFLTALEIKGFTAVDDGKVTRIIPAATARQSGLKVYEDGIPTTEGFITKLIRLNYVDPDDVVRTIVPLITRDGNVLAYHATNSVIVTDSVFNLKKLESIIHAIDVQAPEGKGKINVYYLRNANAEEVAKLMSALVARMPVPANAAKGKAAPQGGPATILEGAVTITADKATNALIIVASPGDFEVMKDVLQKIDIRRRQVYVEAAIIEMGLAKSRELGLEFQVPVKSSSLEDNASSVGVVGGTNFGNIGNAIASGPAALASMNGLAIGAVKGTFTFKGTQFLSIGALLHALQSDGDVNVLSTPNILTLDNQKARIMVGENVPFVASQTMSAATGGNPTYNIERKDVGITLEITPQITSDDNVRLEIKQEISDVIATAGLNANQVGPSTSKRSADTTVVVKDRQTMVIGGLIRDNVVSSTSKVPFLGDIPLLGWLFKSKTTRVEKTNLMIFITPYIISDADAASELTQRKNDALEDFRKTYRIEKKSETPKMKPGEQKKTDGAEEKPEGEAVQQQTPESPEQPAEAAPQSNGETSVQNSVIQSSPTVTDQPQMDMNKTTETPGENAQ